MRLLTAALFLCTAGSDSGPRVVGLDAVFNDTSVNPASHPPPALPDLVRPPVVVDTVATHCAKVTQTHPGGTEGRGLQETLCIKHNVPVPTSTALLV